ncbi:MAG: protease modulator HflC, partial [gamma proteobacterium symbiont of Phacoides pectinatus]
AYKGVFANGGDMMVLEPDSEFFQYFRSQQGAQ